MNSDGSGSASSEELNDDLSYSSNSSEENETEDIEEDTLVRDIPEDYAPSGVESGGESGVESGVIMTLESVATGQNNVTVPGAIKAVQGTPEQGKPSQRFPDNYKPHDLVEPVLDIAATNEHATEDAEFQKRIGRIETN